MSTMSTPFTAPEFIPPTGRYLWEVKGNADDVDVGRGITDDRERAMTAVADTFAAYPGRADHAVMHGPKGSEWSCRRGRHGGMIWRRKGKAA